MNKWLQNKLSLIILDAINGFIYMKYLNYFYLFINKLLFK